MEIDLKTVISFHHNNGSLPICKEKNHVTINTDDQNFKDFNLFNKYAQHYCGIKQSAIEKGLGENIGVKLARQVKDQKGTEIFAINTQQQWEFERQKLITDETSLLQVNVCPKVTTFKKKVPIIEIQVENEVSNESLKKRGRKRKRETEEDRQLCSKLQKGEVVTRTERQMVEFEEFQKVMNDCRGSIAVNEISVKCGICMNIVAVDSGRRSLGKLKYFKRKHFDECSKKKESQNTIQQERETLRKSLESWLNTKKENDTNECDSDVDEDLIINSGQNEEEMIDEDMDIGIIDTDDQNLFHTLEISDSSDKSDSDIDIEQTDSPCSSDCDSDSQFCPIFIEQADPLCIQLNDLINEGKISRQSIFYKQNFDVVQKFTNPRHQYDSDVIEFHNSLEYLGGRKTANFVRGPIYLGQGTGYHSDLSNQRMNLGGPSRPVRQSRKNGYTTSNGVISSLLKTFLLLLKSNQGIMPIIESPVTRIYPVSLALDGTALKAAFEVDDRTKKVVGGVKDYDIDYIRQNPNPKPEELRSNIVSEVLVSYLTTLCNNLSMPIATHFLAKAGKSGIFMKDIFTNIIYASQVCLNCISKLDVKDGILIYENICNSFCGECSESGIVCYRCRTVGHTSVHSSLRACTTCLQDKTHCIKNAVLALTTDCESGNKNALESILEDIRNNTVDGRLSALSVLPDCVHVGKSIKCSFSNWYLILGNERANLSILHTLRNDENSDVRKKLRRELSVDCVRNKDRMDVSSVVKISNDRVLGILNDIEYIVHDIIPERYRPTEDNKPGMFPHPVAIEYDQKGYFVFVDFNPVTKLSRIVKGRLHNPVQLQVLKTDVKDCRSVVMMSGVCLACEYGIDILTISVTEAIGIEMSSLKSKQSLQNTAENLMLSTEGTVADLKSRISSHLDNVKQSCSSNDKLMLNSSVKPCIITKGGDDLILCSSDHERLFYQITVSDDGFCLHGDVSTITEFPDRCRSVVDMCSSGNVLYASFKGLTGTGGLLSVEMGTHEVKYVLENNPSICVEIGGICAFREGILLADVGGKKLRLLHDDGVIADIAGTGVEGCATGSASHASFGQVVGVAVENNTNIYVTDAQFGSVKLVTSVSGCIPFLLHLQKLYSVFSVHVKNEKVDHLSPEECINTIKQARDFFIGSVDTVKQTFNITRQTNGPDGTISKRTQDSIEMIYGGICRLFQIITDANRGYVPNMESCLTTMVENLHALSHLKQNLPTKLQYCRDFGTIFRESVKRITLWAAHYFTSESSYYPLPSCSLPLADIPLFPKPTAVDITKHEVRELYEWANRHGKCVRQRTVRQETTSYKCGTLPLNMYQSSYQRGEMVSFDRVEAEQDLQPVSEVEDEYENESESDDDDDDNTDNETNIDIHNESRTTEIQTILNRNVSRSGRTLRVSSRLLDYF